MVSNISAVVDVVAIFPSKTVRMMKNFIFAEGEKCVKFDVCMNISYQTLFSSTTLIESLGYEATVHHVKSLVSSLATRFFACGDEYNEEFLCSLKH